MRKKFKIFYYSLLFFTILLSCNSKTEQNNNEEYQACIHKMNQAFIEKHDSCLLNILSSDFYIGAYSWPASKEMLNGILQYINIDSIVLLSIRDTNTVKISSKAEVVIYNKGKSTTSEILFNKENKIVNFRYFSELYGYFKNKISSKKAELPFEYDSITNNIILRIKINDYSEELRFIFDSGADGIAISEQTANTIGIKSNSNNKTSVAGGKIDICIARENTIHLNDSIKLLNQNIAIFKHMEEGIDGLIGLNIPRKYITEINFDHNKMYLYSPDEFTYTSGLTIPITNPHSVTLVPATLNITGEKEVNGNFVLDTGADYYFIGFSKFVRKNKLLLSGFKPEDKSTNMSLGLQSIVYTGKAKSFSFDKINIIDIPISLQTSTTNDENVDEDGSIGIRLLNKYNIIINLPSQEINLTERK